MIKNKEFLIKTLKQNKYIHFLEELPSLEELSDLNKDLCDLGCFVRNDDILAVLKELKLNRSVE